MLACVLEFRERFYKGCRPSLDPVRFDESRWAGDVLLLLPKGIGREDPAVSIGSTRRLLIAAYRSVLYNPLTEGKEWPTLKS